MELLLLCFICFFVSFRHNDLKEQFVKTGIKCKMISKQ